MHDPNRVRAMAAGVLGFEPSREDLFGVADPHALDSEEREIARCARAVRSRERAGLGFAR